MSKKIDKSNKKSLKLLRKVDFRLPYQVLVDDSFINSMNKYCKRYKHMKDIFKSEPKMFFTRCILNKYRSYNKEYESDISDNCEMIKCPHNDKSDVLKCLSFIFRKFNKNHYIVGTSNKEVMDKFKDRSDIPLLNFNKGQIRLFINIDKIPDKSVYSTEATTKELDRLEKIFGDDKEEVSEVSNEFEVVDVEDLEVSNDSSITE